MALHDSPEINIHAGTVGFAMSALCRTGRTPVSMKFEIFFFLGPGLGIVLSKKPRCTAGPGGWLAA